MSSKEIVKALRRGLFSDKLLQMSADTIETLENEINRLQEEIKELKEPKCVNIVAHARCLGKTQTLYGALYKAGAEEFAERLKETVKEVKPHNYGNFIYLINNLLKNGG